MVTESQVLGLPILLYIPHSDQFFNHQKSLDYMNTLVREYHGVYLLVWIFKNPDGPSNSPLISTIHFEVNTWNRHMGPGERRLVILSF